MKPSLCLKAATKTKPHQFAIRFLFGGLITGVTGLLAVRFGPVVAGLFLSFPAILPASVSLVQDHAKKPPEAESDDEAKKEAGDDSLGASMGSLGLIAFGIVVWSLASRFSTFLTLSLAAIAWLAVSLSAWYVFVGIRKQ